MALLNVQVAVDVTPERAADAFRSAGWADEHIAICSSADEATAAFAAGRMVAAGRIDHILRLPIDIVVEASGHAESGAVHALAAIEAGYHVALVTKEADSVVGPFLAAEARRRDRVVTPVDGDQPALLMGLVTWAETLGLPIIAAGKSSEYDFVFDPATDTLTSETRSIAVPRFAETWTLGGEADSVVRQRGDLARELPQRTVPDLCEMAVVANATGLRPDTAGFHLPLARIAEVATLFNEKHNGGLLSGRGRLDVFNCLRKEDELSFAGGVFVVVACEDQETWRILAGKGHTMSRDGTAAMLWLPRHILGLEAPISLLDAVINGVSVAGEPKPVVDLVGRTTRRLAAGTLLEAQGHHHTIDGLEPMLIGAAPLGHANPAPYYLLSGTRLARDLDAGMPVSLGDIVIPADAPLLSMRRRQDAMFFPEAELQ